MRYIVEKEIEKRGQAEARAQAKERRLSAAYSAKPAQRSNHSGPPGFIGWRRFQSSLCRLAGLYGYSAELGYLTKRFA